MHTLHALECLLRMDSLWSNRESAYAAFSGMMQNGIGLQISESLEVERSNDPRMLRARRRCTREVLEG